MKFLFDLDGTVTSEETVPLISSHFGVESEIHQLTLETVKGNIPFIESFIRRVNILGNLPVDEVAHLLGTQAFILMLQSLSACMQKIVQSLQATLIAGAPCWVRE